MRFVFPGSSAIQNMLKLANMTAIEQLLAQQVSGDMLEDGKYQCNLKDDLAQRLANNLQINLQAYLLYV